jgi:hypothetical protein
MAEDMTTYSGARNPGGTLELFDPVMATIKTVHIHFLGGSSSVFRGVTFTDFMLIIQWFTPNESRIDALGGTLMTASAQRQHRQSEAVGPPHRVQATIIA